MTTRKKPKAKKKKKVRVLSRAGRKSIYRVTFPEMAYKLCLLGVTDAMMAEIFEVSESTLNLWKKKHPNFSESIKRGKMLADMEVAASLHGRAIGCSIPDDKVFFYPGSKTKKKYIVVQGRKYFPADVAACFIWLKNRAGWKDKQEHEHGINKETADLLVLIDGKTKGMLPDRAESEDAGG